MIAKTTGELIKFLQQFPEDTPVKKSCWSEGDINSGDDSFDLYYDLYPQFKEIGDWPNDDINTVIL